MSDACVHGVPLGTGCAACMQASTDQFPKREVGFSSLMNCPDGHGLMKDVRAHICEKCPTFLVPGELLERLETQRGGRERELAEEYARTQALRDGDQKPDYETLRTRLASADRAVQTFKSASVREGWELDSLRERIENLEVALAAGKNPEQLSCQARSEVTRLLEIERAARELVRVLSSDRHWQTMGDLGILEDIATLDCALDDLDAERALG